MKYNSNLSEAAVYVGTYKKYKNGSLEGKWLNLSDFDSIEEFYKTCNSLHSDEYDREFMFQDYEHIPKDLINESWISEKIFEILEYLQLIPTGQIEPFLIWCDNGHKSLDKEDLEDLFNDFKEEYIGEFDSEEDFARLLIDERPDLSEFAKQYFDYEAYANDLFCGDYWSKDGYIFCIN